MWQRIIISMAGLLEMSLNCWWSDKCVISVVWTKMGWGETRKIPTPACLKCHVLSPPHFERKSAVSSLVASGLSFPKKKCLYHKFKDSFTDQSISLSDWSLSNKSRLANLGCWVSFSVSNRGFVCLTNKNRFWIASFTGKLHHGQILIGSYFMIITLEDWHKLSSEVR